MTKHYVLSINPHAQYDWDQCILRNPITGERPDFTAMIAQAVGNEPGSYLVAVNVEVKVLEKEPVPQSDEVDRDLPKATKVIAAAQIKQLAAS